MEEFLNEFEQFSWTALVEEARRRGVPTPDAMDREALLLAINARPSGRGPLSRARSLLGRVVDTVRSALPNTERRSERPPPSFPVPSFSRSAEPHSESNPPVDAARWLGDSSFHGVHVVEEGALSIVWRVSPEHVERAQAVAAAGAEMRLRTLRISWPPREDEPVILREDHGLARSEGMVSIAARAPEEKVVAAIGLASSDGDFVAIDHATHG